jgi:hypothetical protein
VYINPDEPVVIGPLGADAASPGVQMEDGGAGTVYPQGEVSGVRIGYPFSVSFTPKDIFEFMEWQAFSPGSDTPLGSDVVTFANPQDRSTQVTVLLNVSVVLKPRCLERPVVKTYVPDSGVSTTVNRSKPIRITFSKDIDRASFEWPPDQQLIDAEGNPVWYRNKSGRYKNIEITGSIGGNGEVMNIEYCFGEPDVTKNVVLIRTVLKAGGGDPEPELQPNTEVYVDLQPEIRAIDGASMGSPKSFAYAVDERSDVEDPVLSANVWLARKGESSGEGAKIAKLKGRNGGFADSDTPETNGYQNLGVFRPDNNVVRIAFSGFDKDSGVDGITITEIKRVADIDYKTDTPNIGYKLPLADYFPVNQIKSKVAALPSSEFTGFINSGENTKYAFDIPLPPKVFEAGFDGVWMISFKVRDQVERESVASNILVGTNRNRNPVPDEATVQAALQIQNTVSDSGTEWINATNNATVQIKADIGTFGSEWDLETSDKPATGEQLSWKVTLAGDSPNDYLDGWTSGMFRKLSNAAIAAGVNIFKSSAADMAAATLTVAASGDGTNNYITPLEKTIGIDKIAPAAPASVTTNTSGLISYTPLPPGTTYYYINATTLTYTVTGGGTETTTTSGSPQILLTTSNLKPSITAPGWTDYTSGTTCTITLNETVETRRTIYAWLKDRAGNVAANAPSNNQLFQDTKPPSFSNDTSGYQAPHYRMLWMEQKSGGQWGDHIEITIQRPYDAGSGIKSVTARFYKTGHTYTIGTQEWSATGTGSGSRYYFLTHNAGVNGSSNYGCTTSITNSDGYAITFTSTSTFPTMSTTNTGYRIYGLFGFPVKNNVLASAHSTSSGDWNFDWCPPNLEITITDRVGNSYTARSNYTGGPAGANGGQHPAGTNYGYADGGFPDPRPF